MPGPLRLLLLRQSPDRAHAIERELRNGGLTFEAVRVDTSQDYLEALKASVPDLILSEYGAPSFDGILALEHALSSCPGTPFLFVADPPGEERAIEAIHRGAADFVPGTHLARLVPAVKGALDRAREREQRQRAESALRQSLERHQALLDFADGIVWEADEETFRFTFVNRKAKELLGYPISEWMSDPDFWRRHLHPEDCDWTFNFSLRTAVEKGRHEFECRMISADGRTIWVKNLVSRVAPSGQRPKLRGLMVDVSDLKNAEDNLRRHLQEIAALNAMIDAQRGELSSYHDLVTHDMSNFTMVLLGIVERLLQRADGPLSRRQELLLMRVNRKALEMNRLAENARLMARVQEKGLPTKGEAVPMVKVLREVVQTARTIHFDRPFEFAAECPTDLEISSVPYLDTVMFNLIDNAVRLSAPEPKPSVRVQVRRDEDNIHISIQGGEPPERDAVAALLERGARAPRPNGSELGLVLTREIVRRAGGSIRAHPAAEADRPVFEVCVSVPRG